MRKPLKDWLMNNLKTSKVQPKTAKGGIKYIVFEELPEDQQNAWRGCGHVYTCMFFDEEGRIEAEKYCPYYHDYENFYDNWIIGRKAFHLD